VSGANVTQGKMKICFVLGTRPEITKLYSVMNAAAAHNNVTPIIIHTGQHYDYEMSQVFLEELDLPEFHYFLNVKSGSHGTQTAKLLIEIEKVLSSEQPDCVIVLGDTNTTITGALAASKLGIPVAHVEAGCRSFDMAMPEEINRLVADAISSIFFAPSKVAALNLLYEGRSQDRVFLAGNTVVDIVEETREIRKSMILDPEQIGEYDVVVTLHRQENVDDKTRLRNLIEGLRRIEGKIIFPIHPRTRKNLDKFGLMDLVNSSSNLKLIKPLNFLSFMKLLEDARMIITDSGGVQEEAVMLGVPCITARDTTEWPETVWAGGNFLAGLDSDSMTERANEIINFPDEELDSSVNPFEGNAGTRIIQILTELWNKNKLTIPKPSMSGGKYPLPWLRKLDDSTTDEYSTTLLFDGQGRGQVESDNQTEKKVVRRLKDPTENEE